MSHTTLLKLTRASIVIASALLSSVVLAQGNIDPAERFAWSENSGWINHGPTHGGVTVEADHLTVTVAHGQAFDWQLHVEFGRLPGTNLVDFDHRGRRQRANTS